MVDLEVTGRHALLFDDDAMLSFVNSDDALVEWHSLPIDRYDVRHLLSNPPPPRKRRRHLNSPQPLSSSTDPTELELDNERFLDLPAPSDEQEVNNGDERIDAGRYHSVGFSYGISDDSTEQKNANAALEGSGFRPCFPVPENLLHGLPPTEKLHQIIARTAVYVSKHGGQSEIVLRVKQGDNPTFGFLMPDHHLHAYFRFLVDHQELLGYGTDGKNQEEEKKGDNEHTQAVDVGESGALSLLGSIYGSGEDEDVATGEGSKPKDSDFSRNVDDPDPTGPDKLGHSELNLDEKDQTPPNHQAPTSKEKAPASKRIRSISTVKAGTNSSLKKDSEASAAAEKSLNSALQSASKVEKLVLEPPSDLKKLVEKIVEFIMKNGKEFEAVLVEQDTKYGRFPFLLPSNQYYSYYVKALENAQESKTSGKSFISEKDDSMGRGINKKAALSKETDAMSVGSAGSDIPFDSDRKEKFKMVISKSKKDGPDLPSKAPESYSGVSMDAASAAAIIQAARRGIKYPNLESLSGTSLNCTSHGLSGEGQLGSSFGSRLSSQPQSSNQRPEQREESSVSVPVAKAIAKTAALVAASEADSSEACLTREQKLKAERLKRAKMFASMIKGGGVPLKAETLRGLSVERPDSGGSGSGLNAVNFAGKEREGSSAPLEVDTNDKPDGNYFDDDHKERRSKRSYRSKSKINDGDVKDEDDDYHDQDKETDEKHSRKKHRSHRSSHHSRERHKHRKRHSSSKDRLSRHRHRYESSSDDEHRHRGRSRKHSRRSHSGRETDLEEGEISTKLSDQLKASVGDSASREASLDLSNSYQEGRDTSQPSETSEVPDELRAKIRAMLMATL